MPPFIPLFPIPMKLSAGASAADELPLAHGVPGYADQRGGRGNEEDQEARTHTSCVDESNDHLEPLPALITNSRSQSPRSQRSARFQPQRKRLALQGKPLPRRLLETCQLACRSRLP
jgi:hypothetical protein